MSDEYLTIEELSARLKIKPKTIKNKMASGIFRKGTHFFSPPGLGPRFKWSAVVAWLSFVDPIWDAYLEIAEGGWLPVAGIAITVSASLIGVACAVYTACK